MKRFVFTFSLFISMLTIQPTYSSQKAEMILAQQKFDIEALSQKYNLDLQKTFQFSVGQEEIQFNYTQLIKLDELLTFYPEVLPIEIKDRFERVFYEFSKKTYDKVNSAFAILYMSLERGQSAEELSKYLHDLGIFAEVFTYKVEKRYQPLGYSWYTVALTPILGFFPGTMPLYALMLIGNAMRTVGAEETYRDFAYQLAPMSVLYDDFLSSHITIEAYAKMAANKMNGQYHGSYQKVIEEVILKNNSHEND